MSKQAIYSMISSHSKELVSGLIELTKDESKNIRLQAIKTLLNKIVPDLKEADVKDLIFDSRPDHSELLNDKRVWVTLAKALDAIEMSEKMQENDELLNKSSS